MAGGDAPRHAQMQQQEPGLVELYQDVLAAAREGPDPRPVETRGEHRRKRPAQIRPAQFGTHDAAARHASGKATPDGFDHRRRWLIRASQSGHLALHGGAERPSIAAHRSFIKIVSSARETGTRVPSKIST